MQLGHGEAPAGVMLSSSLPRRNSRLVIGCLPGGHLTGQARLVMRHERHNVLAEGLVPFSPDAPVWEPPCTQAGQQGVICHPGYELQALQQGVLSNVIC